MLDPIEQSAKRINSKNTKTIARAVELSNSKNVAQLILQEVTKYQSTLPEEDDVAMCIVQFGQSFTLLVDGIGYIGNNLILFHGKDSNGKPLELIQSIHQLNFLLQTVPKPQPDIPKREIGYRVDDSY